jgi:Flp pilus assembly protein TadB
MQMLVVTVRIDEERGGKMADALEQAAENVRRDFELGAEAQAELSQEKGQFYGILGILVLFAVIMIGNADPTAKAAYTSMSGFIALAVATANAVFGVVRVLRVFSKARGEI